MAETGHERTLAAQPTAPLFDYLVGAREQRKGHGQYECLGGFQVNDQFDLRVLLDRQIGWFLALKNAPDVVGPTPIEAARNPAKCVTVHDGLRDIA
jgi:hypothetical protein